MEQELWEWTSGLSKGCRPQTGKHLTRLLGPMKCASRSPGTKRRGWRLIWFSLSWWCFFPILPLSSQEQLLCWQGQNWREGTREICLREYLGENLVWVLHFFFFLSDSHSKGQRHKTNDMLYKSGSHRERGPYFLFCEIPIDLGLWGMCPGGHPVHFK